MMRKISIALLLFVLSLLIQSQPVAASEFLPEQYVDPVQEIWQGDAEPHELYAQATPSREPERFIIEDPDEKEEDKTQPLVPWLPFGREAAEDRGYELPLPIGLSVNALVQHQEPKVEDLKFGLGSAQERSGVDIYGSEVVSTNVIARGDVWVLPFMNLYGFGGLIAGHANININVDGFTVGGQAIDPFTLNIDDHYTGYNGGLGMTLAGGYKEYFGSLDVNKTKAVLDFLDGKLDVTTATVRGGILVESEKYGKGSTWLGVMYLDLREQLSGSVEVPTPGPGRRTLEYDLVFTTDTPWSVLGGGMWEISKSFNAMVEVSLGGRTSLLGSVSFRF